MTRDDILRMARQAHHELITQDYPGHAGQLDPWTMRLLERFAALVAAAEREACAVYLERGVDLGGLAGHPGWQNYTADLLAGCAAVIRTKGQQ